MLYQTVTISIYTLCIHVHVSVGWGGKHGAAGDDHGTVTRWERVKDSSMAPSCSDPYDVTVTTNKPVVYLKISRVDVNLIWITLALCTQRVVPLQKKTKTKH